MVEVATLDEAMQLVNDGQVVHLCGRRAWNEDGVLFAWRAAYKMPDPTINADFGDEHTITPDDNPELNQNASEQAQNAGNGQFSQEALSAMSYGDLQALAKARGLQWSGVKKADLVASLSGGE